mgnify:CR=1 FL=1
MLPDGCVLDYGNPNDCIHAKKDMKREACPFWLPCAEPRSKTIKLLVYGLTINLNHGGGTILSDLKSGNEDNEAFCSAMDGLEALILGHAIAGIDITSPAYMEGIDAAVDAINNQLAL